MPPPKQPTLICRSCTVALWHSAGGGRRTRGEPAPHEAPDSRPRIPLHEALRPVDTPGVPRLTTDHRLRPTRKRALLLASGAAAFVLLVLLNVGGYRYGVSDQAFYIPIVQQDIEPGLFPHDAALLSAQDKLLAFDDGLAPIVRLTGVPLPVAFFATYLAGLLVLYAAAVAIGRSLFRTWWGVTALVAALTLRHRIPDTAVNTLEAYLHPRQLAFAAGVVAVAVFLRGRTWMAVAAVAAGFLLHPTTAIWFGVLIGIAAAVSDRESHQPLAAVAGGVTAAAAVLLASTVHEQLSFMSPSWKALLQSKDYLLATDWPMLTWFANLGLAAVIAIVHDYRRTLGVATPRETGLVAGCAVLLVIFLLSVPLAATGIALVVQLQFSRIFWLLDLLAVCYAVWLVVEAPLGASGRPPRLRVRRVAVALVIMATLARGSYVTFVERAGHPLIQLDLPATEWTAVMRWAGERPVGTHFLADPGHAWRYGSSVRAASGRDVFPRGDQGRRHGHLLQPDGATRLQPRRRARRLLRPRSAPRALARASPSPRLPHHGACDRPAPGAPKRALRRLRSPAGSTGRRSPRDGRRQLTPPRPPPPPGSTGRRSLRAGCRLPTPPASTRRRLPAPPVPANLRRCADRRRRS